MYKLKERVRIIKDGRILANVAADDKAALIKAYLRRK